MDKEVKHTPGPWLPAMMSTKIMNVLPHRIHGFVVQLIGGSDGQMIAHVHGRTEKECEANAHLIAAAPELAAMVRELLSVHEAHHNHPTHAAARRLLAKAEGRS